MLQIEEEGSQDFGPCDCCGSMSRLVSGFVTRDGGAYAGYQVHWTLDQLATHGAEFYIILGRWGIGTHAVDRYGVAIHYRSDPEATGFMVVNADETPMKSHPLIGKALRRDQVVGTPLAKEIFDIIDYIWLNDNRISPISDEG